MGHIAAAHFSRYNFWGNKSKRKIYETIRIKKNKKEHKLKNKDNNKQNKLIKTTIANANNNK